MSRREQPAAAVCSHVAGYFPHLAKNDPKPTGGPLPDRSNLHGNHTARHKETPIGRWRQFVEHRTDGAYIYAGTP